MRGRARHRLKLENGAALVPRLACPQAEVGVEPNGWSGEPYDRVVAYVDDGGAADLVSFGADATHGADDFGADGINMVWLEGTGHMGGTVPFDSAAFMTPPFTTNPANVVARRIRSEDPRGAGRLFMSSAAR